MVYICSATLIEYRHTTADLSPTIETLDQYIFGFLGVTNPDILPLSHSIREDATECAIEGATAESSPVVNMLFSSLLYSGKCAISAFVTPGGICTLS
jgi:hypothetical protein